MNNFQSTEMQATSVHLISYLTFDEIKAILDDHKKSVAYAVIALHDKDDNEKHFHVVVYLNRSRKIVEIQNWFKIDERNTLARKNVYGKASTLNYLLHANKESIEDGKAPYDLSALTFIDCDLSTFSRERVDNTFDMLEDVLRHVPLRVVAQKYGRDFIFHYKAVVELADAIRTEEENTPDTFIDDDGVVWSKKEGTL